MSKTKKILIGIILITVVLLGIGYAAIQNVTLNITGTATADPSQSNFIVKFTGTPEVSDSSKVTAVITDDTNATINVEGLTSSGETVTAIYTVQNAGTDLSADLTVETTNSNEEYFIIESELAKTSIVAGESTTLTVTVELIKTPISTTETSTIGIELTATPVQPGEEGTTNDGSTGGTEFSYTLNEYGFYYSLPYSATDDNVKYSYVFFEDGSAFLYENEVKEYELPAGTFAYADKSISIEGTTFQVSENGKEISVFEDTVVAEFGVMGWPCCVWGHTADDGLNHTAVGCIGGHFNCEDACGSWEIPAESTYTMANAIEGEKTVYNAGELLPECYKSQLGDKFLNGDYEYRYGEYYRGEWVTDEYREWNVRVVDDTKTEYGEIFSNINGVELDELNYTFFNCTSMTSAPKIPDGITWMFATFDGCTSLTMPPEIPETVTTMSWTFRGTSLTTAPEIPDSVTSMVGTFINCNNLKTYVGSTYGDGDFSGYVLPNYLEQMMNTFYGCSSMIVAPTIPNTVTSMDSAFHSCTNLKSYAGSTDEDGDFSGYVLPSVLEDMQMTFLGCTSMTNAPTIPESVTDMYYTFFGCTSLTGTIQINTSQITINNSDALAINNGYGCFYDTVKPIVLKGTGTTENTATLELLAGTTNNGNVTVEQ